MNDDATNGMASSAMTGSSMSDPSLTGAPPMGGQESSANTHDEGSFPSDNTAMNMGALQGGGQFGDDSGHADDQNQMNYQRSLFPSSNYVSYFPNNRNKDNTEQSDDLDKSTERDVKSTIVRDDDDDESIDEPESHERVHKDYIPRPEDFGY